jgi:hypothetical protein
MQIITTVGNVLVWSLLSIILAGMTTILVVKIILGVRIPDLLAEIETKQNAAISTIFKDIAAVLSGLTLIFTSTGFTPSTNLIGDILWAVGGGLLTLVLMGVLGFLFLLWLVGRRSLKETPLQYLRRELIQEQNQALADIIMAFLIVIGIAVIGQSI